MTFTRFDRMVFGRALSGLIARLRNDGQQDAGLWPEYRDDPVGFCRHVLGVRPWRAQRQILESIRDNKSTAVASAHGVGKSAVAAMACLWWLLTRRPARVFSTAPTQRQVTQILWRQIALFHRRAKHRLPGKVLSTIWKIGDDRLATGASGRNADAVQGIHSESVLVIYDEASGIPDEIKIALEGAMTADDSRELAIGNPTGATGFFRAAFFEHASRWRSITISALRTPNVRSGKSLIPGLVDRTWTDRMRDQFGADSPIFRNRVLGQFVTAAASERVVPVEWIDAARARWADVPEVPVDIVAVDVARAGVDKTAIVALAGRRVFRVEVFQIPDLMQIVDRLIEVANRLRPKLLVIDGTGIGAGCVDRALQVQHMFPADLEIVDVVLGRRSSNTDTFPRVLDELQWSMRGRFSPDQPEAVALDPDDSEMAEQLGQRTWKLDPRGRITVETKSQLKSRGVHSPDVADAVMLLFVPRQEITIDFT